MTVRIAVAATPLAATLDEAVPAAIGAIEAAGRLGAQVVCLPETWIPGGSTWRHECAVPWPVACSLHKHSKGIEAIKPSTCAMSPGSEPALSTNRRPAEATRPLDSTWRAVHGAVMADLALEMLMQRAPGSLGRSGPGSPQPVPPQLTRWRRPE